jgi:hypothetical protein
MHATDIGLLLSGFAGKAPATGVMMAEAKQTALIAGETA